MSISSISLLKTPPRRSSNAAQITRAQATEASADEENVTSSIEHLGNEALLPSMFANVKDLIVFEEGELATARSHLASAQATFQVSQQRVAKLEQELASARYSASLSNQMLSRIERSIKELEQGIQKKKGLIHPIRKLPIEILVEIFQWSVELQEETRRREVLRLTIPGERPLLSRSPSLSNPLSPGTNSVSRVHPNPLVTAFSLSQVCRKWRNITQETSSLWRYIYSSLSGQPNSDHHDIWRECLNRSWGVADGKAWKKREVDLFFEGWEEGGHPPPVHRVDCLMNVLIPEAMSIKQSDGGSARTDGGLLVGRLEVTFKHTHGFEQRSWSERFPQPRELVYVHANPSPMTSIPSSFATVVPRYAASLISRAKSVQLIDMRHSWLDGDHPEHKVSRLKLVGTATADLPIALVQCQTSVVELWIEESLDIEGNLQRSSWSSMQSDDPLELPKLENLTIGFRALMRLAPFLRMPALKSLTLLDVMRYEGHVTTTAEASDILLNLVSASCPPLEDLRICSINGQNRLGTPHSSTTQSSDLLVDVLRPLDSITRLSLEPAASLAVLEAWVNSEKPGEERFLPKVSEVSFSGDMTEGHFRLLRRILVADRKAITVNGLPVLELSSSWDRRGTSH